MKHTLRLAAVGLIGAVTLTATGGAAGASVTRVPRRPAMAVVKAECNQKINQRVLVLVDMRNKIEHTLRLSPDQKAPIIASINETLSVLNGISRPAVNNADTPAELAQACRSIFVDLRIFAVYAPQVRYSAMVDAVGNFKDNLATKVAAAHDQGSDTTEPEALLSSAQQKLDDASAKIASVSPASFNADPAGTRATWDAVHADIVGAFVDLLHVHQWLHPAATA